MSDNHTIGDYSSNTNVGTTSLDTDNPTRQVSATANVGETAAISATYRGSAAATQESAEAYLFALSQYAEIGVLARKNPLDAAPLAEMSMSADASGTGEVGLTRGAGDFALTGFDFTGASTATFTATNAPAAISPKKWLKVKIGGTVGYIPWFST